MKAGIIISVIKQTAVEKQMYELASNLREVERELLNTYTFEDEVPVSHFMSLLQNCLIRPFSLPDDQRLILSPIIRELKLSQLL